MKNSAFGIIAILLGVATGIYGVIQIQNINNLLDHGQQAVAETVSVDYSIAQKPGERPTFYPVVSWRTDAGDTVTVAAGFGGPDEKAYHKGDRYTVFYDPDAPDEQFYVTPLGEAPAVRWLDAVPLGIAVVFVAIGLSLVRSRH